MLLLHVKGAQSWKDLLTVDEEVCKSFKEAAKKLGLIKDTDEWKKYFEEAIIYAMPCQLRELFVGILTISLEEKIDFSDLWESFKENMYEDFVHQGKRIEEAENLAKADIERQLQINGRTLSDFDIELPNIDFNDVEF